jgi:peptidoglycan/LPS O-acetylase OafA/YrhL
VALFICVIDICARLRPSERVRHVLQILGGATFGVFLVHLVLVAAAMEWLPRLYASPSPASKIGLYVLVAVTAFAISIVAGRIPGLRRVF